MHYISFSLLLFMSTVIFAQDDDYAATIKDMTKKSTELINSDSKKCVEHLDIAIQYALSHNDKCQSLMFEANKLRHYIDLI